jgi:hypothetical protein
VSEPEERAQQQLREIVRELEAVQFRLLGVQASLPPAPMEVVRFLEEEEMDRRTQIRAAVQHVLEAAVRPAIRDLRAAAELREERA